MNQLLPMTPMGPQIVVLSNRFVYHGNVSTCDTHITIENAKNIRRWGTTTGLGQLAQSGPQPNTVLDPAGSVSAPMSSVNHLIQCSRLW